MTPTTRRIRADDGPRLRTVRLAALADSPTAFASTYAAQARRTADEWAERAAAAATGSSRCTFLALIDDGPVGIVGGHRPVGSSDEVELVAMWVAPGRRGTGLGRCLVDHVIEWAAASGAANVGLWVTRGNAAAEALYRSLGFEPTGHHQPLPSDPCRDELRMQRPLREG